MQHLFCVNKSSAQWDTLSTNMVISFFFFFGLKYNFNKLKWRLLHKMWHSSLPTRVGEDTDRYRQCLSAVVVAASWVTDNYSKQNTRVIRSQLSFYQQKTKILMKQRELKREILKLSTFHQQLKMNNCHEILSLPISWTGLHLTCLQRT